MTMFFFNVQFKKKIDILALLLLALCALIILTPFSFRDLNWEQCPKAWILDAWSRELHARIIVAVVFPTYTEMNTIHHSALLRHFIEAMKANSAHAE